MRVVFVGDRPSSRNRYLYLPFVGTPSFKTLCKWIKALEVDSYNLSNSYNNADRRRLYKWAHMNISSMPYFTHFIALGNNAHKVLEELGIPHFKLPHPSGRNRQLNNKSFVDNKLLECKAWLNG
jgi:uracil-DNA glycosylase